MMMIISRENRFAAFFQSINKTFKTKCPYFKEENESMGEQNKVTIKDNLGKAWSLSVNNLTKSVLTKSDRKIYQE